MKIQVGDSSTYRAMQKLTVQELQNLTAYNVTPDLRYLGF